MNVKIGPLPIAFLIVLIAGMLNLFSKSLLTAGLSSMEVGAIREIGTGASFALIMLIVDRGSFKIKLNDIPLFILFAFFNLASNIAMFNAINHLSLGTASVLQMTSPYFVLIMSFFLFGIKITPRKMAACIVAFIGCMMIVGLSEADHGFCADGVLFAILSAITLAAFTIGGKYFGEKGYSENTCMLYFFGFSALMIMPFTDYGLIGNVMSATPSLILNALGLVLISTLLVNYLIIYVTRRMDPGVFSIILSSSIIVSTVFGIVFYNETITTLGIIGIIFVMIGMVILESNHRSSNSDEIVPDSN